MKRRWFGTWSGIVILLHRKGVNYTHEHVSEVPITYTDVLIDAGDIKSAADDIIEIIL
jgi:hypothetical protein